MCAIKNLFIWAAGNELAQLPLNIRNSDVYGPFFFEIFTTIIRSFKR